jgi:UDP-N-acetylmuramyl pentapeptide phosphotransferase/UDP-N-acetylglucosamine-1-phosphate transferase
MGTEGPSMRLCGGAGDDSRADPFFVRSGVSSVGALPAFAEVFAVFGAAAVACALALGGLRRWKVMDRPNRRSSHTWPVPRGGGIGFIVVILAGWGLLRSAGSPDVTVALLIGATAIAAVSFADDLFGVSRIVRLAVQAAAIVAALWLFPYDGRIVADFLPLGVDRLIAALAWLWFVNLFNFMDGIDGIAAGEGVVVALGLIVVAGFRPDLQLPAGEAMVIAASALAFLVFNWPPARMFMGDVGSTGIGFLLGWLLLITAAKGAAAAAFILPLVFLADASWTLASRAWRRAPLMEPHRDHAYQRAVDGGVTHAAVSIGVAAVGAGLTAAAVLAAGGSAIAGLVAASALTAGFLIWMRARSR